MAFCETGSGATASVYRAMLNLLLDFDEMRCRLLDLLRILAVSLDPGVSPPGSLGTGDGTDTLLNAFLLAAGLNQILEDHLHRDVWSFEKVARRLPQLAGARLGGATGAAAGGIQHAVVAARGRSARERALVARQPGLAALACELAEAVAGEIDGGDGDPIDAVALLARAEQALCDPVLRSRPLARSVVRLAHCFRSFDQGIGDCRRLAQLIADRVADRRRAVLIVGLRTSGTYLAPLCAAFLTRAGYADVRILTHRPGEHWLHHERMELACAAETGAAVCVVDDPPRTGAQLAAAAEAIHDAGVAADSLFLVVALAGPAESVPATLRDHQTLILPWSDWSIHGALQPQEILKTLRRHLRGRRIAVSSADDSESRVRVADVIDVAPITTGSDSTPTRGHVKALFEVTVVDSDSRARLVHRICVSGVGIGYLGAHTLAVARRLSGYVPEVYAFENGLLYHASLPERWRLTARSISPDGRIEEGIAAYVRDRRQALAVEEDMSQRLVGREAVWELVADILSDAFGRAKYAMRPTINHVARRLLRPSRPSIVDGSMSLRHWFLAPRASQDTSALIKVDFAARDFSNHDRYCYDAAFDLAGAAADVERQLDLNLPGNGFSERLRREFDRATGETVPPERWLLYQLLHHRVGGRRLELSETLRLERAMARAQQRYFGERYFADLEVPSHGPLCAIDVDWVLETQWLSFPAIAPAGALALRALARHGFRPLIATGRSLPEVRDRCAAYRLAGGVAEYGAVIYDHRTGRSRSLLAADDRAALQSLRANLERTPSVRVHPGYKHAIRAFRVDAQGRRSGLEPEQINSAIAATGNPDRFNFAAAASQTDFTLAHVDKGTGLQALATEIDSEVEAAPGSILAFAAGDSAADLPMLRLAARPFAPLGFDAGGGGPIDQIPPIHVVGRPCQAGLLLAVSSFLGHDPDRCDVCALPEPPDTDARLLLGLLEALDGGAREKLGAASRLGRRMLLSSAVDSMRRITSLSNPVGRASGPVGVKRAH